MEFNSESILQRLRRTIESSLPKPSSGGTFIVSASATDQFAPPISSTVENSAPKGDSKQFLPYILSQFERILMSDIVDLETLRKLSWNGVPAKYRSDVWKMLLGYLPLKRERRDETVRRKRKEYLESVPLYFSSSSDVDRTTTEGEIRRQILVDLPRTCPSIPFFHQTRVRNVMERILYIWAIRHPASGYVQGMNDILIPILLICAQSFVSDPSRTDFAVLNVDIVVSWAGFCVFYFYFMSA
jgi:hypothetical protein